MSGDRLFIGSCGGRFYALDKKTGKELWSYDTRADGGPRSFHGDPLLYDGTVVITTDRGCGLNAGFVYAFDQQSGKVRWKIPASGPSTSFVRMDGSGIFGTRSDEWQSVDLRSGKLNWTFAATSPDSQCEFRKSPVTDGKNIYLLTHDNSLHAFTPSGRSLWTYTPPAPVNTAFILYKDILYFGTRDDRLHGLNPSTAKMISDLKLPATPEGAFACGSIGKKQFEYVFAAQQENGRKVGILLAFDDEFKSVVWAQTSEREWSSEKPHLWRGSVITGNCRGKLAAYRASDGTPEWTASVKGCIRSIAHDGELLYVGTQEGTVYAYFPPAQ